MGCMPIEKVEKRLGITLRDDHRESMKKTWFMTAEDGKRCWRCFKYPFMLLCSTNELGKEIGDIFRQYPVHREFMVGHMKEGL